MERFFKRFMVFISIIGLITTAFVLASFFLVPDLERLDDYDDDYDDFDPKDEFDDDFFSDDGK